VSEDEWLKGYKEFVTEYYTTEIYMEEIMILEIKILFISKSWHYNKLSD
jgi:hypothetical protein